MTFQGKCAVIAGGASGIGRATCELLAERNAFVAILDRNLEAAESLVKQICASGGRASAFAVELARRETLAPVVSAIVEAAGAIDVLVYSAGIQRYGTALTTSPEQWSEVLDVNLSGAFHLTQLCLPHLITARGSVVLVASVQSLATQNTVCAYTVSKHALIGLARSIAVDFAAQGVRANAVCPGTVDTPMLREAISLDPNPEAVLRTCREMHPLGRIAQPREIAEVIAFLSHDSASFVTGAVWTADGGLLTRIGGAPQTGS